MTHTETLRLALEALGWTDEWRPQGLKEEAITAIKAALEAKDEKQKPVNIKKVAEEHGINLPTEFVPKHDESKAAIQSLTDQCAALIWERDELQKQMWRSEKQEPVAWVDERAIAWLAEHPNGNVTTKLELQKSFERPMPLYTNQTQRKPLTDEEIGEVAIKSQDGISPHDDTLRFARAIEAAHGIKGEV
jgi:hypothetical protein